MFRVGYILMSTQGLSKEAKQLVEGHPGRVSWGTQIGKALVRRALDTAEGEEMADTSLKVPLDYYRPPEVAGREESSSEQTHLAIAPGSSRRTLTCADWTTRKRGSTDAQKDGAAQRPGVG